MGIASIGSVTGPNPIGQPSPNPTGPAAQQMAVGLQSLVETQRPVSASNFAAVAAQAAELAKTAEARGTTVVSRSLSNPVGDDEKKRRARYCWRCRGRHSEEAEASPQLPTADPEVHHLDILA